jgi:2-dehydro-3-deoxyphosphogluconate aldolase / (4S)-4-hydroxy-2-oxoglutarate aldolase
LRNRAQENNIPFLPGVVTPTEMILGINFGLNTLKFFPSETMGRIKAINFISDPFPQLRFVATGGIKLENVGDFLCTDKIHAVGGSWMAKRQMIAEQKFDEITRAAKQASGIVKQIGR